MQISKNAICVMSLNASHRTVVLCFFDNPVKERCQQRSRQKKKEGSQRQEKKHAPGCLLLGRLGADGKNLRRNGQKDGDKGCCQKSLQRTAQKICAAGDMIRRNNTAHLRLYGDAAPAQDKADEHQFIQ